MAEQIRYNSKQKRLIHRLLETIFSGVELDDFCAQYYRPVFDRFTADMENASKIQSLIEHCAQQGELGKLVSNIQAARPEAYQAYVRRVQESNQKFETASGEPPDVAVLAVSSAQEATVAPATQSEIVRSTQAMLSRSLGERYQIEEILDESGLGAVFKVHDTRLDLEVAVKVIDLQRVKQPALRERVRQEARTAMKLDHPGIVQVYDFGEADTLLYIVEEFIYGQNLQEVRQAFTTVDRRLVLPQVIQLVRQLCLTLDYMHQNGVLHPGLKPQNIMLKPSSNVEGLAYQPVLINLGLLRPHRETLISGEEIPVEQLTYMVSPELLVGHVTDIRSDVYALGILLYDLVTGRPPFRPVNLTEAVRLHIETPPTPPRSINSDLPEAVEQVILKALAKDPADRYLSAKGLAQALVEALEQPKSLSAPPARLGVALSVDDRPLVAVPGESITTMITLRNDGEEDRRCQVRVQGIPPEWVSISPSVTTLSPGGEQEVELTIQPPPLPGSRAGRHALAVQLVNQRDSRQIDEIKKVLTITPYSQFSSSLWPQEITAGQVTQVTVENQGNTTETFTVRPKPEKGLRFEPDQAQLKLAPGDGGTADFRVTPRRRWVGEATTQTFSVVISSGQGKTATHGGAVASRGMLSPKWILAVGLGLALFLCVFASFYQVFFTALPGAATAQVFSTQTAVVVAQATQTTGAEEAATAAVVATATWMAEDTDGDGLTNSEELNLHTAPDNPDSDQDGLPDGKEVNQFKTDPTLPDSDFDGLSDYEEVRNIWDPSNRDTDGDGTPDFLDDNPGQPPTPTALATRVPITISFSLDPTFLLKLPLSGDHPRYAVEENQGVAKVEVLLSAPAPQQIQVDYATAESNATVDEDYRQTAGTLVFAPGEDWKTFDVTILDDNVPNETGEVIVVTLKNPVGASISTPRAELFIIDDD